MSEGNKQRMKIKKEDKVQKEKSHKRLESGSSSGRMNKLS